MPFDTLHYTNIYAMSNNDKVVMITHLLLEIWLVRQFVPFIWHGLCNVIINHKKRPDAGQHIKLTRKDEKRWM